MTTTDRIMEILAAAKRLAQEYRNLTGKPLGITGEIAEYEAARLLDLQLTDARHPGYDATDTDGRQLQIKGRCILAPKKTGQRIGSIDVKKPFDAVLLVLLDDCFDATAIYEAPRDAIISALTAPGSKARNERGAMGVNKFKAIGALRWRREP